MAKKFNTTFPSKANASEERMDAILHISDQHDICIDILWNFTAHLDDDTFKSYCDNFPKIVPDCIKRDNLLPGNVEAARQKIGLELEEEFVRLFSKNVLIMAFAKLYSDEKYDADLEDFEAIIETTYEARDLLCSIKKELRLA